MSAQAFLLGIYDHFDKPQFDEEDTDYSVPQFDAEAPDDDGVKSALPNRYYPFPVLQVDGTFSPMFEAYHTQTCREFSTFSSSVEKYMKRYYGKANEIIGENDALVRIIQDIKGDSSTDVKIKKPQDLWVIVDYLSSMKYLGVEFGLPSTVVSELKMLSMILESFYFFQPRGRDIIVSHLAKKIQVSIDAFESSENKKSSNSEYQPFVFFAGNKLNVWGFLQALGLTSTSCLEDLYDQKSVKNCMLKPPVGSSLIFEIYEDGGEGPYIGKIFSCMQFFDRVQWFFLTICFIFSSFLLFKKYF